MCVYDWNGIYWARVRASLNCFLDAMMRFVLFVSKVVLIVVVAICFDFFFFFYF